MFIYLFYWTIFFEVMLIINPKQVLCD